MIQCKCIRCGDNIPHFIPSNEFCSRYCEMKYDKKESPIDMLRNMMGFNK